MFHSLGVNKMGFSIKNKKDSKTFNEEEKYVKYIENEVIKNGGIIFDPENGNLHINKSLLELPADISEMPSHELGNTLNVFTQQKIYLRTAIMRLELMAESAKRKFYSTSKSIFAEFTSKRMSESAKERLLATNENVKPLYEEYTDKKYILSYMQNILSNIEDSIFLLSREISRRSSDYTDENRSYNVQNKR